MECTRYDVIHEDFEPNVIDIENVTYCDKWEEIECCENCKYCRESKPLMKGVEDESN